MQSAVYTLYKQNGSLRRGVLSQIQYSKYSQDPSIQDLQVYASQQLMEQAFLNEKGISGKPKTMLLG